VGAPPAARSKQTPPTAPPPRLTAAPTLALTRLRAPRAARHCLPAHPHLESVPSRHTGPRLLPGLLHLQLFISPFCSVPNVVVPYSRPLLTAPVGFCFPCYRAHSALYLFPLPPFPKFMRPLTTKRPFVYIVLASPSLAPHALYPVVWWPALAQRHGACKPTFPPWRPCWFLGRKLLVLPGCSKPWPTPDVSRGYRRCGCTGTG
jgi:hypothetical protein